MSNDSHETFFDGFINDKWTKIILGIGLIFLVVNIVVSLLINIKLSTILFALNLQYWSTHSTLFLWIAAIWIASESTEAVEDYLPLVRMVMMVAILTIISFAIWGFIIAASPSDIEYSLWQNIIIVATVCCAARSLFLFYDYRYDGADYIDVEEAQWFWGMSGFLFTALSLAGLAHIITVQKQYSNDPTATESLFASCLEGLRDLIQQGHGSTGIRTLGFLILVTSIAFIYVAGKWTLIFLSRFRRD
jgi:hypothetical protein